MKDLSNDETIFDFATFFGILKKNIISIFGCAVGGFILSLIISFFFLTPKYSSSIDLLVNQKTQDVDAQVNAQQADLQAISTYKDILSKSIIIKPVFNELQRKDNYNGSLADLKDTISISNENNSQVMTVTATDSNPYIARDTVNILGDVFKNKIKKMMKINNVTILSEGVANNSPVFPNKKVNSLIGFVIGLLIGVLISVIRELFDTTVKDSDYLTKEMGLSNLGTVYHIKNEQKRSGIVHVKENNSDNMDLNRQRRV